MIGAGKQGAREAMKAILLACALSLAGCASEPATVPPAAPAAAPGTAAANGQPQQPPSDGELQKQRLADALKRGYKLVNTNGEELYCRSDLATASHIQKNTVCLTARQLDEIHLRNQQSLEQPNTPINMKNNFP
jgi:uncharacterized lipoprotein YmbA